MRIRLDFIPFQIRPKCLNFSLNKSFYRLKMVFMKLKFSSQLILESVFMHFMTKLLSFMRMKARVLLYKICVRILQAPDPNQLFGSCLKVSDPFGSRSTRLSAAVQRRPSSQWEWGRTIRTFQVALWIRIWNFFQDLDSNYWFGSGAERMDKQNYCIITWFEMPSQ